MNLENIIIKGKKLSFIEKITVPDVVTQTKFPELRAYDNIGG